MTESIGTCGHTPERIKARMDAHDAEVAEHMRQEENVLRNLMMYGTQSSVKDARAIIDRARRAEGR